jgi:imidazoleglycerol phosphate dehydratase HisB
VGLCLNAALGDKASLARMGCAEARSSDVAVRCVLDLSNRPFCAWDLPLDEEYVGGDAAARAAMGRGGDAGAALCGAALTCEMLQHVFESLTVEARATVHGRETYVPAAGHTQDLAIASARAHGSN